MGRNTTGAEDIERILHLYLPAIWMYGGDIDIHEADPRQGTVTVELCGACNGCGLSPLTHAAIQSCLSEEVGWVQEVTVESSGLRPEEAFPSRLRLPTDREKTAEE